MTFTSDNLGKAIEMRPITDLLARPLTRWDTGRLIAHFQRMNEVDRYTRFFSAVSDDGIRNIVNGFDWSRMIAVGAFRNNLLLGIAELGWECGQTPARAELAMSVDREYRNVGLASWLIKGTLRMGQDRGVREVYASWIGGNDPVGRIMNRLNARMSMDRSVCRADITLDPLFTGATEPDPRCCPPVTR